jgi:hypothetical protein
MLRLGLLAVAAMTFAFACGDDADDLGIGAQCTGNDQCDAETMQVCLQFKGGYCGLMGCATDADCPDLSACVMHDDGTNYCFRTCVDKAECNANRDVDNESNCSSSVTWVEPGNKNGIKACVPPSA